MVLTLLTLALCLGGLALGLRPWLRTIIHPKLEPAGWPQERLVLRRRGVCVSSADRVKAWPTSPPTRWTRAPSTKSAVNGVAALTQGAGPAARERLQTGYVRNYALGIAAGSVALLLYVAIRAGG